MNRKDQTKFIVNEIYTDRSACNYDCIFSFLILSRTKSTITFDDNGTLVTRKVKVVDGVEQAKPFGSYSMAAVIRANTEIDRN
ncbi:MAG: hypothetical protein WCK82_08355 [Bacteroidota bacterium]